ncbi:MAG TPA: phage holin family protein [Sphingomicrobium sp.]|nr:phage holin family protein [Sphingomicrobium sp.]
MLKPAEPTPPPERPIGELVHELVEEGKAYARAEADLAKAIALAKAKALALPAGLLLMALIVLQSAVTILAVGIFAVLSRPIGPLGAAIVASLIYCAIAGGLAWWAIERARRAL